MTAFNFDARKVDPSDNFEPLPVGWYTAMIVESEIRPTRDDTGRYIKLQFQIMDEQYKNRRVFTNLNIWNANPVAVEIAQKELSAICHSVGVLDLQDTQQLHGKPIAIRLTVKPAEGNYDAMNNIRGYKEAGGLQQQSATPAFAHEQQQSMPEQQPQTQQYPPQTQQQTYQPPQTQRQKPQNEQQPYQQQTQQPPSSTTQSTGTTPPWAQGMGEDITF